MAGESAREVARRQREKADRLSRTAELYERGAVGEEVTAAALAALPASEWAVFHDIRWPGRRYANVDHVVVGPPGVFVIDSKNWSGSIVVRDQVLRQNGRSREPAVAGAAEAALAVAQLTREVPVTHVHPVLCFVRDEPLTGWARDVMVCSTGTIVQMLTTRPAVLTAEQRRGVALDLDASTRAATDPAPRRTATAPARPWRTPPARPAAAPTADRTRRPRPRRHRNRANRRELVKLGVLAALAAVVLYVPGANQALADAFAKLFDSDQQSTVEPSEESPRPGERADIQE